MANRLYGFGAPTGLGDAFVSDSDLSVTPDGQGIVLAWTRSKQVHLCRYDGSTWGPIVKTGAATTHAPAIARFRDRLYLVWVRDDKKARYGTVNRDTLQMESDAQVPNMSTKSGVGLAVYNDALVLLHIGEMDGIGGRTIYQLNFDGTSWSKEYVVKKGQESTEAPVMAASATRLYQIHRGKTDGIAGRTVYDSFNVEGGPEQWSENKQVRTAESNTRPGAGMWNDYVIVVHAGKTSSDLRCVYCPGTTGAWRGDERIGDGYKSDKGAAVVSMQEDLLVFFVGDKGRISLGVSKFALKATVHTAPFTVGQFIPRTTPGNVAVCLSGGGSRAMSAGMGQLLALETIAGGGDGGSLLSQTRMLSTVSGGSWVGATFTFLPSSVSDQNYLGGPYAEPSTLTADGIGSFPTGCIGERVGTAFDATAMIEEATWLLAIDDIPPDMVWQTIIGDRLLAPYGLFPKFPTQGLPAGYFTYDPNTREQIVAANPSMKADEASLVSRAPGQQRPFLVCNMALSVNDRTALAPVQSTPFFTGVVGSSAATDASGRAVGNGGVTSFAFSSTPTARKGADVTVEQPRHWTLVDAIGTSSCAYAGSVILGVVQFAREPERLATRLRAARPRLLARSTDRERTEERIEALLASADAGEIPQWLLDEAEQMVPRYTYWPTSLTSIGSPPPVVTSTLFADGGNLENLGLASALSYADIDNAMAFVNAPEAMRVDGGRIVVDGAIPPLFGFQPFDAVHGYVPYSQPLVAPANAAYAHNQVFEQSQFQLLLDELWTRSAGNTRAAFASRTLTTVPNSWFGVSGARHVKVLWFYLQPTQAWVDQLPAAVRRIVAEQTTSNGFPNYSTFETQLESKQVNLVANLTAWTVLQAKDEVLSLYGYR